jgi:spermidine/putrescine transport system ATP-binding protein
MSKSLVVFDKVVKRFGDFVAVKQMDLEIGQGEFVAIMGPSAAARPPPCACWPGLKHRARARSGLMAG